MSVMQYGLITIGGLTAAMALATSAKTTSENGHQDVQISAFEQSLMAKQASGSGPDFTYRSPLTLDDLSHIELQDQHGKHFSLAEMKGKTVLINFMFASCISVCPPQTAALKQVYRGLSLDSKNERDINLLSISISPLSDTHRQLKKYTERFDITGPNWRYAVANQAQTDELTKQFSVGVKPLERDQLDHRSLLYLINPQGVMIQQYRGDRVDVERLVRELNVVNELG